jgi:hypothetical protein
MPSPDRLAVRRFELVAAEYVQQMGARIAARRQEKGLSQIDVARALPGKVDGSQVSRWERGLHRPGDDTLERLGEILDVPVSYFMAPPGEKNSGTPDPFPAPADSDVLGRLTQIEAKLDALQADRDDHAETVEQLLQKQSGLLNQQTQLLDTIRAVAAGLGVPDGTTLQDHLAQLVRDTAVRDAAAQQRRRAKT